MFVAGLVVVALLAWATAHWLVTREWSTGAADERWPVPALAPMLGAVLASAGLAGADEELERTAAVPWRRIRAAHIVLATAAASLPLVLTGLWAPHTYGAFELGRNTVACVGMVALSSVVLGARLAWAPVVAYVAVVLTAAPRDPETGWWTWPVQPWSAQHAAWTSLALFVAGMTLYARCGARPSRDPDT